MGSKVIVLPSPPSRQHLGFLHRREDLTIEEFIPEFPIKAFDVAVLPRAAAFDEERLDAKPGKPGSDGPGHELRAVVQSGAG